MATFIRHGILVIGIVVIDFVVAYDKICDDYQRTINFGSSHDHMAMSRQYFRPGDLARSELGFLILSWSQCHNTRSRSSAVIL